MTRNLLAVLRPTKWVIDGPCGAARALGLHPDPLRSRLKKLGITRSSHAPSERPRDFVTGRCG
jgi:formate hydrogenlyase transcriptional activator